MNDAPGVKDHAKALGDRMLIGAILVAALIVRLLYLQQCARYPNFYDTSGLKTSFGMFLLALTLWLVLRLDKAPRFWPWPILGIGLAAAANLSGHLTVFIFGLLIWLTVKKQGREIHDAPAWPLAGLLRAGLLVLGMVIGFLPFLLRNGLVAKDWVLSSATGGIHFYIGNNPTATGWYHSIAHVRPNPAGHAVDARRVAEQALGRSLRASEVSAFWQKRALDFIADDPSAFIRLCAIRAALVLSPYELPNNENYQYLTGLSPFLNAFLDIDVVIWCGLAGAVLCLFTPPRPIPLFLFLGGFGIALILSFVAWRYRLPLTLALWPFAGHFIVQTIRWLMEKRFGRGAAALLLSAAVVALATLAGDSRLYPHAESDRNKFAGKMAVSHHEARLRAQRMQAEPLSEKIRLTAELARLRQAQMDWEGAIDVLVGAQAEGLSDPILERMRVGLEGRLGRHADSGDGPCLSRPRWPESTYGQSRRSPP